MLYINISLLLDKDPSTLQKKYMITNLIKGMVQKYPKSFKFLCWILLIILAVLSSIVFLLISEDLAEYMWGVGKKK